MDIFIELSLIIFIATIISIIMKALKQPLIVGYILSGLVAGPSVLNILHSEEIIELFSKIGIIILLFIVGLNLNPLAIREVGKTSFITGVGQIALTTVIGFIIATLLGLDRVAAIYVAIALTLSSTIIVLKLLSDKGDINALYGKIAIGLLIVQDVAATLVLLVVSSLKGGADTNLAMVIFLTLTKGVGLILVVLSLSKLVLHNIVTFAAKSQELLFLFSICWGLCIASVFYLFGFSIEIGALVAGVTLAATPFAYEISSRLKPLRDFFILLFFILLGSQMELTNIIGLLVPAIILSLFVLIGNPIIMVVILNLLGFNKRVGFKTGLTVAQISEFSLILATLAFEIGQIPREILSLITMVALITIAGSTYLMLYDDKLFPLVSKLLDYLQIRKTLRNVKPDEKPPEAILFGYHRIGQEFVKAFQKLKLNYVVVDFNPDSIKELEKEKLPYKYGDAEDMEFLEELNVSKAKIIVSTIPDFKTNSLLVEKIKDINNDAVIIVLSHNVDQAKELYESGASYVIMPHYLGAQYATQLISKLETNIKNYHEEKEKHLKYLHRHYSSGRV
jgi:Kef-type K+ transport system membrane component KefB